MSFGSPLGSDFEARASVLCHPVACQIRPEAFCSVTGCARSALRRSSNAIASGLVKACSAMARRPGSALASRVSNSESRLAASAPGPLLVAGGLRQAVRRRVQRSDILRVARARADPLWIERRLERLGGVLDLRKLFGLPFRHEILQRHGALDLRQRRELLGQSRRIGQRRRQDLDRVDAGVGIASQFQECRDRFDLRAFQVQRIEVEAQIPKQRRAPERDQRRSAPRSRSGAVSMKRSTGASAA